MLKVPGFGMKFERALDRLWLWALTSWPVLRMPNVELQLQGEGQVSNRLAQKCTKSIIFESVKPFDPKHTFTSKMSSQYRLKAWTKQGQSYSELGEHISSLAKQPFGGCTAFSTLLSSTLPPLNLMMFRTPTSAANN